MLCTCHTMSQNQQVASACHALAGHSTHKTLCIPMLHASPSLHFLTDCCQIPSSQTLFSIKTHLVVPRLSSMSSLERLHVAYSLCWKALSVATHRILCTLEKLKLSGMHRLLQSHLKLLEEASDHTNMEQKKPEKKRKNLCR